MCQASGCEQLSNITGFCHQHRKKEVKKSEVQDNQAKAIIVPKKKDMGKSKSKGKSRAGKGVVALQA